MKLSILRGSLEIGGSCVKISHDGHAIIIDMGLPLYDKDGKNFDKRKAREMLPDEPGLYKQPYIDAILLSHSHQDHYGLIAYSAESIPVYASKGSIDLTLISEMLEKFKISESRFRMIKDKQVFIIGPFEITAYSVDHSAYDSMAFKVKAGGKTLVYSGDFRANGQRNWVFENLLKGVNEQVDALLLEGTMIGGTERQNRTEENVEDDLVKELQKEHKGLTFISFSSQNIGRFRSIYRACVKTRKTFIIDPYQAYILEKWPISMPKYNANNIKVYCVKNSNHSKVIFKDYKIYKFGKNKISVKEILENPEQYVIIDHHHVREAFKKKLEGSRVIWSMWEGYLKQENNYWAGKNVEMCKIHASGHADVAALKKLADKLKPGVIIPIHTNNPCKYADIFKKHKVLKLADKEETKL
ncbi:MAG: hypothetical protein CVV21_05455 [Candidatus Goldiibacteriota bacterium HGW-Goldbacteria-1]|jgi:ribonuclease J|nr:MAG: hypothetical protein CVV21_05455 [Candidatus Goldiibacteriota bacterium HGW-Goldbacteria-1]